MSDVKLIRIAVGQAWDPRRIMINHSSLPQRSWDTGQSMNVAGWTHQMSFWAWNGPAPGTIRVAVGEAHRPHRIMINHDKYSQDEWDAGKSMTVCGWRHKQEFWVYPTQQPGTIRIAVGQAWGPRRTMVNHDSHSQQEWNSGMSMSCKGWQHKQEFWVYPTGQKAMTRIAVGHAMSPHRDLINHSKVPQEYWDKGQTMSVYGWRHKMEFYAFSEPSEDTIRIAVGEAWNPHRMMYNHDNKSQDAWNAGASMNIAGWKHKCEFWAYPDQRPGTIRIAVGQAWKPSRALVNHSSLTQADWDAGHSMSVEGWTHKQDFWVYPKKSAIQEQVITLFSKFDTDRTGVLDAVEFSRLMENLDPKVWTNERVQELLASLDKNCDGCISFSEFVAWVFADDTGDAFSGDFDDGTNEMSDVCYPSYWVNVDNADHFDTRHEVTGQTLEMLQYMLSGTFKRVRTRDRSGEVPSSLKIVGCNRIEDAAMWKRYLDAKQRLEEKRPSGARPVQDLDDDPEHGFVKTAEFGHCDFSELLDQDINEMYLFHGTSPAGADSILENGFRISLAGSNAGTMFGKGCYFAEACSKSDEYATDEDGVYSLLLCRVCCGELYRTTTSDIPGLTAALSSGDYDSVLGDREAAVGTYREFVVFDQDQIYPEYQILYERVFGDAPGSGIYIEDPDQDETEL